MLRLRLREPHPRYGWPFIPSSRAAIRSFGRQVHFACDSRGERTPSPGVEPDPARPTILFGGESMAMGHGLEYGETFAVHAAAQLGAQAAFAATNGYGVDQAALRLLDELPRHPHLTAAVLVVLPVMLGRNL